jgi:hypothetical protein
MAEASRQGFQKSGKFVPLTAILAKHDHRGLAESPETLQRLWRDFAKTQTVGADKKGYIPPYVSKPRRTNDGSVHSQPRNGPNDPKCGHGKAENAPVRVPDNHIVAGEHFLLPHGDEKASCMHVGAVGAQTGGNTRNKHGLTVST